MRLVPLCLALAAGLVATPALAHVGGTQAGFLHPFTGADHLLAMVAVGLWSGLVLKARWWAWPAAFAGFMLAGFSAAQAGAAFPAVETVILASVVALGLAVAFDLKLPALAGAAAVAVFGAAHGFAHGGEVPAGISALRFAGGFLAATLMLHLAGVGLALLLRRAGTGALARITGAAVALGGLVLAAAG